MEDFFVALFPGRGSEEIEVVDTDNGATIRAQWRGQEEGCRAAFPLSQGFGD